MPCWNVQEKGPSHASSLGFSRKYSSSFATLEWTTWVAVFWDLTLRLYLPHSDMAPPVLAVDAPLQRSIVTYARYSKCELEKAPTTFGLQRIQIFKRSYTYSLPNSLQQNKSSYNSEFSSFCIVESMNGSFATIQNDDGRTWDTPGHYKSKDGASKWRAFHGENEMNWFYRKFVLKNSICS